MSELEEWDSFYVIVLSVPGALIGLQFVVVTLLPTGRRDVRRGLAPHLRRLRSFISAPRYFPRQFYALPGKASPLLQFFWGWVIPSCCGHEGMIRHATKGAT